MKENEKEIIPQAEDQMNANEYAEEVKKLKANSVSKAEYDKVVAEKKVLAKALAEGADVPEGEKQEKKPADIKELRKKLLSAGELNLSNVEYVQTALELRKALIADGQKDPFLPTEIKRKANKEDYAGAERVAEFLENCLEDSKDEEGKPDEIMFNALLSKGIANDNPMIARAAQEWAKKMKK